VNNRKLAVMHSVGLFFCIVQRYPYITEHLIKKLSLPTPCHLIFMKDETKKKKKREFNLLLYLIDVKVQENARATRL